MLLKLAEYNYTTKVPEIDGELIRFLYKKTNGNPALLKQIIVESQVYAISSGYEKLDKHSVQKGIETLVAFEPYLNNEAKTIYERPKIEKEVLTNVLKSEDIPINIFQNAAKTANKDIKKGIRPDIENMPQM